MDVEKFVKQIWGGHKDAVAAICIVVEAALKEDRKEREVLPDDMPGTKARTDAIELADPLSARLERLAEIVIKTKNETGICLVYRDGIGWVVCYPCHLQLTSKIFTTPIAAVAAALEECDG